MQEKSTLVRLYHDDDEEPKFVSVSNFFLLILAVIAILSNYWR
jgi:hypothetical protein